MRFKKRSLALLMSIMVFSPITASAEYMPVPKIDSSFKTYMDYRAITDRSSKQYQLQESSSTHCNGIRVHKSGRYVIAIGTYYAEEVGKKLDITLDNGYTFHAIVGDIKQEKHTDPTNKYVPINNSVLEFVVQTEELPKIATKMGDVSYVDENLQGKVVKIKAVN